MKRIPFTADEAIEANSAWGFNCGPATLCAIFNATPAQIRPHLLSFEERGYTNPTLLLDILDRLKVRYSCERLRDSVSLDDPVPYPPKCDFAIVRVQWGGTWTKPGVPIPARYKHTHWIAVANEGAQVFDVNATLARNGEWCTPLYWSRVCAPSLSFEETGSDRTWWFTHAIEILSPTPLHLP